jgi:acyl-CoA thioester hydrolase
VNLIQNIHNMPFSTEVEIRFSDIDNFGHVNNAHYLSYIEQARLRYFNEFLHNHDWQTKGIILARAEIDFQAPLFLEDKLTVELSCSRIGSKSFDLSYKLMKNKNSNEQTVATALTIIVSFDYIQNHSTIIPEEWKEVLMKIQD